MHVNKICLLLTALMGLIGSVAEARADRLTPQRLSEGPALSGETTSGTRLSPDGRFVAWLKPAADDAAASVLWVMPVRHGAARALIDSRTLGTTDRKMSDVAMKALERRYQTASTALTFSWSPEGKRLLLSYGDDLYAVDAAGGRPVRLTSTPGAEVDPQLAPGGRFVSFTRGPGLVVRSLATGAERRIGSDASDAISYGAAEFIAQEEMRRFTGQWWSPDGSRIAYTRVDESGVKTIPRVLIDPRATKVANERYPLAGTPNAKVQLFVEPADGGTAVAIDLGDDPDVYLADVRWSRDGRALYVERQSRDQKQLDLLRADPVTGRTRVLVHETSDTWVDLERDFWPLSDGGFLWGSARSGWRHLYRYDSDGTLIRQVTSGDWRIANITIAAAENFTSVVGVDERRGLVYFVASIATPIEQQLYRVSYRHADVPHPVTSGSGWWTPYMAEHSADAFLATYSDPLTPPRTALYSATGARLKWLDENRLGPEHPLWRYMAGRPTYEYGTLKAADGSDLHYVLAKPAGFDPSKRYPAIVRVYGGPGVQTVRREWRNASDQLLAEHGYVVFQLDNRGSANRSEAFEHALAGDLGGVGIDDQRAGVRFLGSLPFIDARRIGMMGWSFGGYVTVRLLTEPDSRVRAGAAGGTPSDFALYDTHYTERFLGKPQDNAANYTRSGLLPRAGKLNGDLMLLQGLSDDNVVIGNFTALAAELQARGKLFETSVYPGMGHVPRGPHILEAQLDFFQRRLTSEPVR